MSLASLTTLSPARFETTSVLKKLASASRSLAELKGFAASIPNQAILVNTLSIQEAKDSSAIENIVTTHDELFKGEVFPERSNNAAAKEVLRYRQALNVGFNDVAENGLLTTNHVLNIQSVLEQNHAGFRKLPGTLLKDGEGKTVYTPPQDPSEVIALMGDLEKFVNDQDLFVADPLIKMAIMHHRFESIRPFYDGNGRTGRILNVLFLVKEGLLDTPILYMSRYIVQNKSAYYRLLQDVRDHDVWELWVEYMLDAVEITAKDTLLTVTAIRDAMISAKHSIRAQYKFYSQDLINSLFNHPYTKIEFIMNDLKVSRLTAVRYLEELTDGGVLEKRRVGRSNYYINVVLYQILTARKD